MPIFDINESRAATKSRKKKDKKEGEGKEEVEAELVEVDLEVEDGSEAVEEVDEIRENDVQNEKITLYKNATVKYRLKEGIKEKQNKLSKKYKKLAKSGRVRFITFHSSYCYEEFVEGITIRADEVNNTNGDNNSNKTNKGNPYIYKDGLFKRLCAQALAVGCELDLPKYMDWKYFCENEERPWKKVYDEFSKKTPKKLEKLYESRNESGDQKYIPPEKRFLLIIDEINRGSISKIFGELITLLEKDKRLGEENEIITRLPYTNDEFGVPPNVYILATMNTADRSIAFLDTALRRRFGFQPMWPELGEGCDLREQMEMKTKGDWKSLDELEEKPLLVKSIDKLQEINKEILADLGNIGRDKQIGHSYFFSVKNDDDVIGVWKNEIFPLLEEYYFGMEENLAKLVGKEMYDINAYRFKPREKIKEWLEE